MEEKKRLAKELTKSQETEQLRRNKEQALINRELSKVY